MAKLHGRVEILHDKGHPLDIKHNGIAIESMQALMALPPDCLIGAHGYVSVGAQQGASSISRVFRNWLKGQVSVSRVIQVPREASQKLKSWLRRKGAA